ncbi:MAG: glycosyltransferase family 2 protein [Clostridiales bacterium]|nr:glycosyltransferase family 2 protein [Clostridiales bacterium]
MKVSIIIPIYNSENYLEKCIGSAVSQTYDDIEIILVNDGSTDNSGNICLAYGSKDNRIKLISKKNAGVSAARNAGLDIATGDLITFIDSDDHIESDYVSYLAALMEQDGSDMSCCQYEDLKQGSGTKLINGTEECLREYLTSNEISVSVCCKLYKRSLFDGLRIPEGKRYEDNYILYRLIARCSSITVGYLKKYNYVSNPSSFVNEPFSGTQTDIVDASLEQRDFIEKNYPSLTGLANSRVIYAANRCLVKMADSNVYDKDIVNRLKPLYKRFASEFLNGPSSSSAKNFCRIARISPKLAMSFYNLFSKER